MIKKFVAWWASFLFLFFFFFFSDCCVISLGHTSIKSTNGINKLYIMNTEFWLWTGASVCARSSFWGKKIKYKIVPWGASSEQRKFYALNRSLDLLSSTSFDIKEWMGSILGTYFLGVTSVVSGQFFAWAAGVLKIGTPICKLAPVT